MGTLEAPVERKGPGASRRESRRQRTSSQARGDRKRIAIRRPSRAWYPRRRYAQIQRVKRARTRDDLSLYDRPAEWSTCRAKRLMLDLFDWHERFVDPGTARRDGGRSLKIRRRCRGCIPLRRRWLGVICSSGLTRLDCAGATTGRRWALPVLCHASPTPTPNPVEVSDHHKKNIRAVGRPTGFWSPLSPLCSWAWAAQSSSSVSIGPVPASRRRHHRLRKNRHRGYHQNRPAPLRTPRRRQPPRSLELAAAARASSSRPSRRRPSRTPTLTTCSHSSWALVGSEVTPPIRPSCRTAGSHSFRGHVYRYGPA